MKFNLKSRQFISLVKYIFSLNIFFLAGTFLFHSYFYKIQNGNWENGSNLKYLLVEFSLATENVLATWYSSMLLLFVGILFFINYLIRKNFIKRSDKFLSYGWLIFSGIFCLLSLDELASLHERLGSIEGLNPLGDYAPGWVALLAAPIIFVGGFMIWFCLLQAKGAPVAALFAVAGIFLFASIPVQEYYEMKTWQAADNIATWERPVAFLLLEEGSELFGTTFLMISGFLFAYYGSNAGKKISPGSTIKLRLKLNKRNTLLQYAAGSLIIALFMLAIVNNDLLFLEGDNGKRENWFPAATAFLSSLLCLYLYLNPKSSSAKSKMIFLYLSLFCLFISAYYGGNIYSYMDSTKESYFKISIVAFAAFTTLALAIKLFISVKDPYTRTAVLLWACLLIPAYGIFSWYSAVLTFTGFSILSVSLLNMITSKVPVTPTLPLNRTT